MLLRFGDVGNEILSEGRTGLWILTRFLLKSLVDRKISLISRFLCYRIRRLVALVGLLLLTNLVRFLINDGERSNFVKCLICFGNIGSVLFIFYFI